MPTLEFKGKQFVYSHHLSIPFRELRVEAKNSLPAAGQKPSLDDNLIIHGDNLEALKGLLPPMPARSTAFSSTRPTTPATKAGATTTMSARR